MSHLKKTTTTPLRALLYQLPGALCYKQKKALDVVSCKAQLQLYAAASIAFQPQK